MRAHHRPIGALLVPLLRGCGMGVVFLRRGSQTSPPDRGVGPDYILARPLERESTTRRSYQWVEKGEVGPQGHYHQEVVHRGTGGGLLQ